MTKTRDKADKAVGHLRFEKSAGRYRVFGTVNLGHNFQNRDEEVEYGTVQRHRGSPRWLFQCSRTQQGGFHYKTRWEAARALYLEYLTDPEILPKGNDGGTQDRILRAARAVARKYGEESHIAQFHMHDHRGDWLPLPHRLQVRRRPDGHLRRGPARGLGDRAEEDPRLHYRQPRLHGHPAGCVLSDTRRADPPRQTHRRSPVGKGNPWREVIHIREGVGSRGGLYWDLLLECGHLTFRSRPAFDAARFAGLCLAKDTDALLAHYGAPKKCRCWHCGEGGADPLSQAAILAHIKLREKMDQ